MKKMKTNKTDRPIIVFYLNVDGLSRQRATETINEIYNYYKKEYDWEIIILPVTNQETKVELLNPVNLDEEYKSKIDKISEIFKDLYSTELERRKRKLKKLFK